MQLNAILNHKANFVIKLNVLYSKLSLRGS